MSSLGQGLEQIFGVSCSVSLYRQLTVAWGLGLASNLRIPGFSRVFVNRRGRFAAPR